MIDKNTTLNDLIAILCTNPEAAEAAKGEMLEKEVERLQGEIETFKDRVTRLEECYGQEKQIERLLKKVKEDEKALKGLEKKLASNTKLRRPGARILRENGTLIGEVRDMQGIISAYTCGYAFYKNISRQAVIWVPDALNITRQYFTKLTRKEKESTGMSDYQDLDIGAIPWHTAMFLLGEEATWKNAGNQNPDDGLEEKASNSIHMSYHIEGPEEAVLRKEYIEESLAVLTPRQREVFLYYKVWGFNEEEVAKILGIRSVSTICEHLKKLRATLEEANILFE